MVSKWVKALKNQLDDLKNRKSRWVGADRKEFFPEEENQLFAWFLQMREAALAVTYYGLKIEMLKLVTETAAITNDPGKKTIANNFKASSKWLKCFLHRYDLTQQYLEDIESDACVDENDTDMIDEEIENNQKNSNEKIYEIDIIEENEDVIFFDVDM
ncbi:753_t:CDS:2 [Ambispora leptoticha]|uniref:753_t:CDS:1 n=1 Tax=Ambispora leptoticha TaxID=144679 RepID=A0A9N8ZNW9_9GLOM|nr:753_t:CDS:2 [Ambispora leptoticha]